MTNVDSDAPECSATLLIGVGNEFRGDDAVGLLVARDVAAQVLPGVTVRELSGSGADLLGAWAGRRNVIIVDAASTGGEAGSIYRFDAAETGIPAAFFHYSSHAFGVAEAVELGRTLGLLPQRVLVFGIEGGHFDMGAGLSPAVAAARKGVVARLLREIESYSENNY